MHPRCGRTDTSCVNYTTSCKNSLVLLRMGEITARNMLSWLELLISRYCCIYLVIYIIVSIMHGQTNIKSVYYLPIFLNKMHQSLDKQNPLIYIYLFVQLGLSAQCGRLRKFFRSEPRLGKDFVWSKKVFSRVVAWNLTVRVVCVCVCCMSATDIFVPAVTIFLSRTLNIDVKNDVPVAVWCLDFLLRSINTESFP